MGRPGDASEGWRVVTLDYSRSDDQNRAAHKSLADPTWEHVRDAILSLDGGREVDLTIEAANENHLMVSGGGGRYTAGTQTGRHARTGVAATLVNPAGGDEVEGGVLIGGCLTQLPEKYVVDLGLVQRAAERFYRDGELEPSLVWEPY